MRGVHRMKASKEGSSTDGIFSLDDPIGGSVGGDSSGSGPLGAGDADALLTATSVRMSLAIMKCLGPAHPELFGSVAETLIALFQRSSPLAFSNVSPNSPQGETIRAIIQFAGDAASECNPLSAPTSPVAGGARSVADATANANVRSLSLGLMLAVAVTSGSLLDVLSVTSQLQGGTESLPLSTYCFLDRLTGLKTELELVLPTSSSFVEEFNARVAPAPAPVGENQEHLSSTVCTDGVYLYVWEGQSGSLVKMGTGFHGTIAGNEYARNADVVSRLTKQLGDKAYIVPGTGDALSGDKSENDSSPGIGASSPSAVGCTLRVIAESIDILQLPVGVSIHEFFRDPEEYDNSDSDEEDNSAECGAEFVVQEEANIVVFEGDELSMTLYRIGERRWVNSFNIEGGDSDSDIESSVDESSDESLCSTSMSDDDERQAVIEERERRSANRRDRENNRLNRQYEVEAMVQLLDSSGNELPPALPMVSGRQIGLDGRVAHAVSAQSLAGGPAAAGSDQAPTGKGDSAFTNAALGCANGKIYLRMMHLLGPVHVAAFSATALKLEDISPLDLHISSLVKAKNLLYAAPSGAAVSIVSDDGGIDADADEDDIDIDIEWVDGEKVNYATLDSGASVVSVIAGSDTVTPSEGADLQAVLQNNDDRVVFSAGDDSREIIVDLGQMRTGFVEMGVQLHSNDHDHVGMFPSPVEIHVSVDGNNYVPWGTEDRTLPSSSVADTGGSERRSRPREPRRRRRYQSDSDMDSDEESDFSDEDSEEYSEEEEDEEEDEDSGNGWRQSAAIVVLKGSNGSLEEFKYVKYQFGRGEEGTVVQVSATCCPKIKKESAPAFPFMTSDCRYLYFIHSVRRKAKISPKATSTDSDSRASDANGEGSGDAPDSTGVDVQGQGGTDDPLYDLEVHIVDPLISMHSYAAVTLRDDGDIDDNLLRRASFVCNGEKLLLVIKNSSTVTAKTDEARYGYRMYNLLNGKSIKTGSESIFIKKQHKGFPRSLCFDARNNFIWSYDAINTQIMRWRNTGLPVVFQPPIVKTLAAGSTLGGNISAGAGVAKDRDGSAENLFRVSVRQRVEILRLAVNEGTHPEYDLSQLQAVYLLSQVEKLGEPYGPPAQSMGESHCNAELTVISAGRDDGNFCRLEVRGQNVGTTEKGFNLALLSDSYEAVETKYFDTCDSSIAAERLADYIDSIPENRIVLVAVSGSGKEHFSKRARGALGLLGADKLEKLCNGSSFALIGKKGASPGSAPCKIIEPRGGKAVVRYTLPPPRIPLAVEVLPDTINALVSMVTVEYDKLKLLLSGDVRTDVSSMAMSKLALLSCLNTLTVIVHQLIRGVSLEKSLETFTETSRNKVMQMVQDILDSYPAIFGPTSGVGDLTISKAALRLFITSIDLLYPYSGDKCVLLVHYLDRFASGKFSDLERSVLKLLMEKMSNAVSLSKLLTGTQAALSARAAAAGTSTESVSSVKFAALGDKKAPAGELLPPADLFTSLLAIAKAEGSAHIQNLLNRQRSLSDLMTSDIGDLSVGSIPAAATLSAASVAVAAAASAANELESQQMSEAATQMLTGLFRLVVSLTGYSLDSAKLDRYGFAAKEDASRLCLNVFSHLCETCSHILSVALSGGMPSLPPPSISVRRDASTASTYSVGDTWCEDNGEVSNPLDDEVDATLKASAVGTLMPMVACSMAVLLESQGSKLLKFGAENAANAVKSCLSQVNQAIARTPAEKLVVAPPVAPTNATTLKSSVFESRHPYQSNTDQKTTVTFPGCLRITISFDDRTRTENSYDWVKIWKNADQTDSCHPDIEKYSGRRDNMNWPGFGGRPPLVIEADTCYVMFHSDGSNEDWGYAFTAEAEFPAVSSGVSCHWLIELEKQLCHCGAMLSRSYLKAVPWDENDIEERNSVWLEDRLLEYGLRPSGASNVMPQSDNGDTGPVIVSFLASLVDRPEGSLGASLCAVMKGVVQEDQGHVDDINRAVYATCAALIKHHDLCSEALSVAEGTTKPCEVSDLLRKVWRAGQKMRHFFDVGDISALARSTSSGYTASKKPSVASANSSDDDDLPSSAPMARSHSAYKGASVEARRAISDEIVSKASFLLRMGGKSQLASDSYSQRRTKSWKALSRLTRQKSYNEKGARWKELVGAVKSTFQFKEHLEYRRKLADKSSSTGGGDGDSGSGAGDVGAGGSCTERILRFVQGKVDVKRLELLMNKRNIRANYRSEGLELVSSLLETATSPFSITWLIHHFASTVRSFKKSDQQQRRVHVSTSLDGFACAEQNKISGAFCILMTVLVSMMACSYDRFKGATTDNLKRQEWKEVTMACLRACAMDYQLSDHDMLDNSSLLTVLERLLCAEDEDIKRTAWSLFKYILPRSVGLDGIGNSRSGDDLTDFGKRMVALLVNSLESSCQSVIQVQKNQQAMVEAAVTVVVDDNALRGHVISGAVVPLSRDSLGLTVPHLPLNLKHSWSLWVCPAKSTVFSASTKDPPEAKTGGRVIRGPNWPAASVDDGGDEFLGSITSHSADPDGQNQKVTVVWDKTKVTNTYNYGRVVDGVPSYEVAVVDPAYGGHILCKGLPGVLSEEELVQSWASFGLRLRRDGRLSFYAACGDAEYFIHNSPNALEENEWAHVAVVQDGKANKIYVNGQLVSAKLCGAAMQQPGVSVAKDSRIIESPHPYADGTDLYETISFPGARSITVSFDSRTKTESSYDYIKFYKGPDHGSVWGDDKYHGGRGGSRSNWPGLQGRPALRIPAAEFVLHFRSDNSNNDWGYRFTATAEYPEDHQDGSASAALISKELNRSPIYIGQTSDYVHSLAPETKNKDEVNPIVQNTAMEGGLCMMHVFESVLTDEKVSSLYSQMKPALGLLNAAKAKPTSTATAQAKTISPVSQDSVEDTQTTAVSNAGVPSAAVVDEEVCLTVLALMQRIVPSLCSTVAPSESASDSVTMVGGTLGNVHVVRPLLSLICAQSEDRTASSVLTGVLRICSGIFPSTSVDLVDSEAISVGLVGKTGDSFVRYLLCSAGKMLNAWVLYETKKSRSAAFGTAAGAALEMKDTFGDGRMAVVSEQLHLLRCLAVSDTWSESVVAILRKYSFRLPSVLEMLHDFKTSTSDAGLRQKCLDDSSTADDINIVIAIFAMFGGSAGASLESLFVGSRALYEMGNNMFEDCTVLLPCRPPTRPVRAIGAKNTPAERKAFEKELAKFDAEWSQFTQFGDAYIVALDSLPSEPIVVPKVKLNCVSRRDKKSGPEDRGSGNIATRNISGLFHSFLESHLDIVEGFFREAIKINCEDSRPQYAPRFEGKEVVLTFESPHPYTAEDTFTPVKIEGASEIVIEFDSQCRTLSKNDFLTFYKSDKHAEYFGEARYSGRGTDHNWPAVHGKPALVIPKDSFDFLWHAPAKLEDSGQDSTGFGYKFTAKAFSVSKIAPPSRPPLFCDALLSSINYGAMQALKSLLQDNAWMVSPVMTIVEPLVAAALRQRPTSAGIGNSSQSNKPMVIEGTHP